MGEHRFHVDWANPLLLLLPPPCYRLIFVVPMGLLLLTCFPLKLLQIWMPSMTVCLVGCR